MEKRSLISGASMPKDKTYPELLKDPRWQKKRLFILQRDSFCCQSCGDNESTLHVHHTVYFGYNIEPWKYPDMTLVTLCEKCHETETKNMKSSLRPVSDNIQHKFFSYQMAEVDKFIDILSYGKHGIDDLKILSEIYNNKKMMSRIRKNYFKFQDEKS